MDHFVSILGSWRTGEGPLHARLSSALAAAVDRADLGIGTTLPAERTMAEALHVSRGTVVAAMRALAQDGVVQRTRGSGSVVAARASRPAGNERPQRHHTRLAEVYSGVERGVIEMVAAAPLGAGAVPDVVWQAALDEMNAMEAGTGYFYAQGVPELRVGHRQAHGRMGNRSGPRGRRRL